ncbi:L30e-like protein [Ramicandelaber brevisporus]|nr:L30e-like protein [Ramicandelaber brevisporus]
MGKSEKKDKKEKRKSKSSSSDAAPMEIDTAPSASTSAATTESALDKEFNPANLASIAQPLARDRSLLKKLVSTTKKAHKHKHVKRGVKEVVKGLRKGDKGLVLLAGDIAPIDVISHIPVLCEDSNVPYVYVPSRELLGEAGSTKRPTSCLMIVQGGKTGKGEGLEDYKEGLEKCKSEIATLDAPASA